MYCDECPSSLQLILLVFRRDCEAVAVWQDSFVSDVRMPRHSGSGLVQLELGDSFRQHTTDTVTYCAVYKLS